jgi:adenylylsulfate kinase
MSENRNNLFQHSPKISSASREQKAGHKAAVLWFTGFSGSGKSTLSQAIEERLHTLGYRTIILDGDNVRNGLCSDLGFSLNDRSENIRRVGEVAKLFVGAGVLTLAAFISPLQKDRAFVRSILGDSEYFEIYCRCSLAICEARDVKGIYKKARSGKVSDFTGIDSVYEEPVSPDLIIDTANQTIEQSIDKVFTFLRAKKIIT